jgi:predicted ATPase
MAKLPAGTVTFVFTDIEGSTRLLDKVGTEAYAKELTEHRARIRDAFARHGGAEVDTQGDAFFYAFETAQSALAGARDAQAALAGGSVRVRVGIHTGTAHRTDEGYVGADVHRAARVAACGHGGQILVSTSTAALVGDELRDLGEHRLKDLSAPERIYQANLGDFAPLRTLYQTNLPVPSTPFLGRDEELFSIRQLIDDRDVRLLTLTGSPGTGKTRLALQAAAGAAELYPDGVWWVPLAPLRDHKLVLPTAARALGAQASLENHIADRRMLLLFDNFEQVVEAGPRLVDLLSTCPRLNIVATSRELLRLSGEHEYSVPPLRRDEGVDLFSTRARSVDPGFTADEAVPELCRRLDDLPLTLELAAARIKVLSPAQILERIEHRLPLLTGGARDLPERQRTLEATIRWSYELLRVVEQALFRRIAVFSGGCTLEAAQRVAGAELDSLQSLVEKSLLRRTADRYWMLESIREYAVDRLESLGEAERVRERHAAYFLEFVEAAGLSLEPEGEQQFTPVREELDNLRAAIDWGLDADAELALALAASLDGFWAVTAPDEGMRRLDALLKKAPDAPLDLRARALRAFGSSANPAGDDAGAEQAYEQSLAAYRELGDERGTAVLLLRVAMSAFYRGDLESAAEVNTECLELSRAIAFPAPEAQALGLAGELEWVRGDAERGVELIGQSADLAGEIGFAWWRSRMLRKLVDCLLDLRRTDEAAIAARESLALIHSMRDRQMTVFTLARVARLAMESGDERLAGVIWGAIEAEEKRNPMGAWAKERERLGAPVLEHAGPGFDKGREEGAELDLDEAVGVALEQEGAGTASRPAV